WRGCAPDTSVRSRPPWGARSSRPLRFARAGSRSSSPRSPPPPSTLPSTFRNPKLGRATMQIDLEIPALVGQLIVGGFAAGGLSPTFAKELAAKRRGGAILFKRNLPGIPEAADLCAAILEASPRDLPPFIAVDQEGGRVKR